MKRTLIFTIFLVSGAFAAFAAVDGFSGRTGFTCSACHSQPITDDTVVVVEGLPDAYDVGETYLLTVRVEGGPPANPVGPQGGFEMDVAGGDLAIPSEMEGLLRTTKHGMTYLPDGTFMRQWNVLWEAPGLEAKPGSAYFWVAAVSANGNHNAETNTSAAGEFGDEVATFTTKIDPSQASIDAWEALPLLPPELMRNGSRIEGMHQDANATGIQYTLNGETITRETGRTWWIDTKESVEVQSIGAGRESAPTSVEGAKSAPFPLWPILLLFLRRNP